jgi:hypothetical protein
MISAIEKSNKNTNELISYIKKDFKEFKLNDDIIIKEKKTWNNNIKHNKIDNCAICLSGFGDKRVCITSCSHCFHKNCLTSFEIYDIYYEKRCPICRSNYDKKELYLS